jgi:hypothetical protein
MPDETVSSEEEESEFDMTPEGYVEYQAQMIRNKVMCGINAHLDRRHLACSPICLNYLEATMDALYEFGDTDDELRLKKYAYMIFTCGDRALIKTILIDTLVTHRMGASIVEEESDPNELARMADSQCEMRTSMRETTRIFASRIEEGDFGDLSAEILDGEDEGDECDDASSIFDEGDSSDVSDDEDIDEIARAMRDAQLRGIS